MSRFLERKDIPKVNDKWIGKQKALTESSLAVKLAELCSMTVEETLDCILTDWRKIPNWEYGEGITWGQALKLRDEIVKIQNP